MIPTLNHQLKLKPTISIRRIGKLTKRRSSISSKKIQHRENNSWSLVPHARSTFATLNLRNLRAFRCVFAFDDIFSMGVPGRKV